MNFLVKDDSSGGSVEFRTGSFLAGDGGTYTVSGNVGLPLGPGGFANLSVEYGNTAATSRSVQRADAAHLISVGNTHVADPAQIWGSPAIDDDFKFWGNFGRVFDQVQLYGHTNYAGRRVTGGFFFRNPNTRAAVFSPDGGRTLLIGDRLDARDGVPDGSAGCPRVGIENGVPQRQALDRVFADPDCFSFQEIFPGGFRPQFGGELIDASVVAGLRGQFSGGMVWDASFSLGSSEVDFFIFDTVNASLGPATPTEFDPGLYRQQDLAFNLDLSYAVNDRVHLAGGGEWREEDFKIGLGQKESWEIGPYAPQGFSAGSNGFPGFSPIAAGQWDRANYALYGDLELRGRSHRWTVGAAARIEDYEDFGATLNGKLAGRYRLTPAWAVRGSVSSGFRAPTPGQQNAFNVSTRYDLQLRDLVNDGTIPSTSRAAQLRGGRQLEPEHSVNTSLGVVADRGPLSLTVDYFRIGLSNRLALTQLFALSPGEVETLISEGITSARNLQNFRFFTNDFETRTQGIDLVATVTPASLGGATTFGFLFNHADTEVTEFNPGRVWTPSGSGSCKRRFPELAGTSRLNTTWGAGASWDASTTTATGTTPGTSGSTTATTSSICKPLARLENRSRSASEPGTCSTISRKKTPTPPPSAIGTVLIPRSITTGRSFTSASPTPGNGIVAPVHKPALPGFPIAGTRVHSK